MSESQKMLMQIALIRIAEMDRQLKEKLVKEEKEKDWEEVMEDLSNQAYRQSFMGRDRSKDAPLLKPAVVVKVGKEIEK